MKSPPHSYFWALSMMQQGHRMKRLCWANAPLDKRKLYAVKKRVKVRVAMATGRTKEYRPSIDTVLHSSDWNYA